MDVEIVIVELIVWLAVRVTLVGLMLAGKPAGETVEVNATVPEKPLKLVTLRVEVAVEPALIVKVFGNPLIEKSGVVLVLNVAVCAVSESGLTAPLTMETQTLVETLVLEQPVWNPNGILEVLPVTLYAAVKRSPVVALEIQPGQATTAK